MRMVGALGMRPVHVVARWCMVEWGGWVAKGERMYVILKTGVRFIWVSVLFP